MSRTDRAASHLGQGSAGGVVPSEGASEKALSERHKPVEPAISRHPPDQGAETRCLDYLILQGLLQAPHDPAVGTLV